MGLTEKQKLVVKGIGSCTGDESMLNEHILEFNNILKNCSTFNMQSSSGNSEKDHWICMYYSNKIIHIYDSLNVKYLKEEDTVFINRLFPNNPELKITFETVQSETNSYDC